MADIDTNNYVQNGNFYDQFRSNGGQSTPGSIESFNGDVNKALSTVSGGFSLSGLTSKISSIGSVDTVNKFLSVSKFKDTFGSPPAIPGPTPDEVTSKSVKPPSELVYPEDLADYFITFKFFERYQKSPIQPVVTLPEVNISLPLPANLKENFQATYSEKQLGIFGILEEAGMLNPETAGELFSGSNTKEAISSFSDKGGALADVLTKGGNKTQNSILAVRGLISGTEAGAALDRATGAVFNPHQALQFEGVTLRKHSFSFRLSPSSEKESRKLKAILLQLKKRMLPEKTGLALRFPNQCSITITTPAGEFAGDKPSMGGYDSYIIIKKCYLESMSINYAPAGVPSFFSGGRHPTEIEVELNFGEIEPVVQNDFTGASGPALSSKEISDIRTASTTSPTNNNTSK